MYLTFPNAATLWPGAADDITFAALTRDIALSLAGLRKEEKEVSQLLS